jgi:hypothetical protein
MRGFYGLAVTLSLLVAGCGGGAPDDAPETAPVKGKITRRGAPLPGVSVTYQPLEAPEGKSNPSIGSTNENGEYELMLSRSTMGAVPGKHQVTLRAQDGRDDEDPSKKAPNEVVIPVSDASFEVVVPAEGLDGGDASVDLDF